MLCMKILSYLAMFCVGGYFSLCFENSWFNSHPDYGFILSIMLFILCLIAVVVSRKAGEDA